jgi:hypothetical protein
VPAPAAVRENQMPVKVFVYSSEIGKREKEIVDGYIITDGDSNGESTQKPRDYSVLRDLTLLLLMPTVIGYFFFFFPTRYKTIERANNFYPSVEKWELFGLHSSSLQSSFANLAYMRGEVKLKIKIFEFF